MNLTLTLKTTVVDGEYQASGNDIETLYTALDGQVYGVSGITDNIAIVKNTTSEYYDLWHSYFSDLGTTVTSISSASYNDISNSSIYQVGGCMYIQYHSQHIPYNPEKSNNNILIVPPFF